MATTLSILISDTSGCLICQRLALAVVSGQLLQKPRMKSSGVCVVSCTAFRGSDRFTAIVLIRQRHARIFAGFNSQAYNLADSKFFAKAEWGNGGTWFECHPVAAGVAQPACPGSVQEVGMDGITTETLSDGTQLVGVNTQPAVANRHWRVRIALHLTPKP
jgi:hypothetical protein